MTPKLSRSVLAAAGLSLVVANISAQNLLLRYNFDEANSGAAPALDLGSAPAAPGAFVGSATRIGNTPGAFSTGALDLTSGTAPDHVSGGDVDKLDALSRFTLTGWINLQGAPANGNRIMAKQITTGNFDGFSFAFSNPTQGTISASNFQLNLALGGSSFVFNTSGADMSADNQWRFVAVTYDGALNADNLMFYNGAVDESVAQFGLTRSAAVGALVPHANEFRVGASSAGNGASAPLLIDDIRVYDGVLSVGELEAVRLANVPEPSVTALLGAGLALFLGHRRRK